MLLSTLSLLIIKTMLSYAKHKNSLHWYLNSVLWQAQHCDIPIYSSLEDKISFWHTMTSLSMVCSRVVPMAIASNPY